MKKNKKIVSILLTLAFMASFIIPSAAFASDEVKISGAYKYVEAGKSTPVAGGTVTIAKDAGFATVDSTIIYYEINLPSGVEVTDGLKASVTSAGASDDVAKTGLSGSVTTAAFNTAGSKSFTFGKLDVDSNVTGNIVAEVKVWGEKNQAITWEYNQNVTIAKVNNGSVTVSAADKETVSVGAGKVGADITIKETTPQALATTDSITVSLVTAGVKWIGTNGAAYGSFTDSNFTATVVKTTDKVLTVKAQTPSGGAAGKIVITPKFTVQPGTTGDIKVKVSGDVDTQEFVIATIGEGTNKVSLDNNDNTVYLGTVSADLADAKVTIEKSSGNFAKDDFFTLTLPQGLKWATCDTTGNVSVTDASLDDNRTAWFTFTATEDKIELKDIKVDVDYNAPIGNIEVTAAGDVEGKLVIGKVAAPLTITTDKVNVPLKSSSAPAGKIVVTEVDNGLLKQNKKLDFVLPMGVSFAKLPSIDVTEGDLAATVGFANSGSDKSKLEVTVTNASSLASTFELTDIAYTVDNRASEGPVNIEVGAGDANGVSDNALATISNATIVSDTASKSAFVIGSTSFTVNGVTKTLDAAPYLKNDRTYLPLRFVANAVGVSDENIIWNAADQSVVIIKGDRVVKLAIGSNVLYVNGIAVQMDTAAEISNGRTMLPVRWVAQALGASINWDAATQTVSVEVK